MERRTICIQVRDYLMQRAGESAGASGSDRAAALRLTFDQSWAGLTKTVYFTDAREEASTSQVLGLGDLVMKLLTNFLVIILNYVFSKLFIFKK